MIETLAYAAEGIAASGFEGDDLRRIEDVIRGRARRIVELGTTRARPGG